MFFLYPSLGKGPRDQAQNPDFSLEKIYLLGPVGATATTPGQSLDNKNPSLVALGKKIGSGPLPLGPKWAQYSWGIRPQTGHP